VEERARLKDMTKLKIPGGIGGVFEFHYKVHFSPLFFSY